MSGFIKQLRDDEENAIYPISQASAIYMPNGIDTVERYLADSDDFNSTIKFSGQTIEKTLASGGVTITEFLDNTIREVTRNDSGVIVKTKTTTFNDDGTIRIEVV